MIFTYNVFQVLWDVEPVGLHVKLWWFSLRLTPNLNFMIGVPAVRVEILIMYSRSETLNGAFQSAALLSFQGGSLSSYMSMICYMGLCNMQFENQ